MQSLLSVVNPVARSTNRMPRTFRQSSRAISLSHQRVSYSSLNGFLGSREKLAPKSLVPTVTGGIWKVSPVMMSQKRPSVQVASAPMKAPVEDPTDFGFEEVKTEFVQEYNSLCTLYKHIKTGAEVMSVVNEDENKVFGAVFRTPPENSTGIPHILEHSVLCGSRKYPIKEPFVELMKGSLNTFLNAFTYPDRTCYPVASTNLQDYYNLVDVYLDAVLHPNCMQDCQTFEQEGWHYELNDPKEDMTFKGVVFNEMKGVYSSPDSVLGRECQQAVFPDTYGVDSGGDPVVIPELTFEMFQDFHSKFYHPSNGRFWFYGDDEPSKRLEILDAFLAEFEARPVDSKIQSQKFFKEPKYVVKTYAAGDSEATGEVPKTFLAVNWLLAEDRFDTETDIAMGFLDYLLLGTSAAPLRQVLEESGLGEAVVGGGLEDELRQPTFCIGLKGVAKEDVPKVEELIMAELTRLSEVGFSEDAIEAAVNTIEFSMRENNTGRFPRGLSLMLRSMSSWLYEGDAFEPMKFSAPLAELKARLAKEDVFKPLLKKYFLENSHKVTLELQPETGLGAKMETEEKAKIQAFRESLTEEGINEVVRLTEALKAKQETVDSPEALKCIPSLALADIPKESKSLPCEEGEVQGAKLLTHELFTNDVLYVEVAFDMRTVSQELLPLVPLFCRCLTSMGTETADFIDLTQRIGQKTGGLSAYPFTSDVRGKEEPCAYIMLKGKTMAGKADDLMEIMREVLLEAKFDDQARFKQMVLETKAGMEARVVGSGHSVAGSRLDGMNSTAGWVSEQMNGLAYLQHIRKLVERVDSDWEGVLASLEAIRSALLSREGCIINLTGDEKTLSAAQGPMDTFLSAMPAKGGALQAWDSRLVRANEGLVVPTQVNYVGKAANLYDGGYKLNGSAYVISKMLGTTWLWDRVRVSGGAYGGFCDFDSHSGMFTYLSYRDPNLLGTLDNYDGTVDFLRSLEMDEDSMTKAIIGCIGDIDSYQLPDAKGYTSFMRYLLKIKDEERQQRREEILSTTVKDFHNFADALETVRGPNANIVAVASADAVAVANEKIPDLLKVVKVL